MPSKTAGAWPVDDPLDLDAVKTETDGDQGAMYEQRASEEARRHFIGASVRQHLAEQPTPNAVRAVLRHYISDFTQAAEEVIAATSSTETDQ